MRKILMAATAAMALGLGTVGAGMTAAMAQMHGGAGGHAGGGGGVAAHAGGGGAAPIGAGAAGAARAGVTAAPNTFTAGRANVQSSAQSNAAARAAPNMAAATPAFTGRNRAFAWRGDRDHDRFHRRRFAFFPGVGIYDYAGPNCYYDPNQPWTYNNCYRYGSPSYNWDW